MGGIGVAELVILAGIIGVPVVIGLVVFIVFMAKKK